jgi:hypothetical protein
MAIKIMIALNFKNRFLWRNFFVLSLFLLSTCAYAGQLVASVDRDTIGIQETFALTVSADSKSSGQPDFSTLKNDFEILSNNVSQFTSISNAGSEFKKVWQLTLAPKRVGTLLIPSFDVDGAISDAIEIKVSKQSQTQTSSDEQVQVVVETDKSSLYVQEQLLLKIKLISQVNLSQAEMQPIDIKDAVVIPLSDKPKQYVANINGKQHLILESNYAVFPQNSGDLVIPSVIYSVVPNAERDMWSDPFGRNRNNILRIPTEEKHISVNAVPALAAGKSWQPANNLTLHETWSASLDHLKMGEPVTRTITISADGLTGGQISPLSNNTQEGLTFYPDQPQNNDTKTDKGIQGTRVETMAIIPNRGGEFTLPEVSVDWWDSKTQSMQTATLPAKKLNVLGGTTTPQNLANIDQNTNDKITKSSTSAPIEPVVKTSPWYLASTILFAILSTGLAIYILKLKSQLKEICHEQDEAAEIISEKEKHIWDLLKHASSTKDAVSLRKNVLIWAKFQWPEASIHSLDDVAKLAGNIDLTQRLKTLDELLYSNHPTNDWDANYLLSLLNDCRKEKNRAKKTVGLKPLYNT